MKKAISLLVILTLLILPFMVKAEDICEDDKISITSIEVETIPNSIEEVTPGTVEGKTINLNLSMSEEGDYIQYKLLVKNDSNQDYELSSNSITSDSDYVEYSIETEDGSNVIEAKSSKNALLTVRYANQVPSNVFENGTYNNVQSLKVEFTSENTINVPDTLKNKSIILLFIIVIVLVELIVYSVIKKKNCKKIMMLLIAALITIPICTYAVCVCKVDINSSISFIDNCYDNVCVNDNAYTQLSKTVDYCTDNYINKIDNVHFVNINYNVARIFIGTDDNNVTFVVSIETDAMTGDQRAVIANFNITDNTTLRYKGKTGDEASDELRYFYESLGLDQWGCLIRYTIDENPG